MVVRIDEAHHGVGSEVEGIHMSCLFSLRRDESVDREKCVKMLQLLCESIMERVDGTYKDGSPSETDEQIERTGSE
jgi:hypothetical protein